MPELKKPRRQNLKPPGKCAFCGEGSLSKEHLFADWLRDYFPRTNDDKHVEGIIEYLPNRKVSHITSQGHSGSKKIRRACEDCNSGWMSQLDNNVRNILPPIFKGYPGIIDQSMQAALAAWFTKIAIVGDCDIRKKNSYIPQEERTEFTLRKSPSRDWKIMISSYEGTSWKDLCIFQHGGKLDISPVGEPNGLRGEGGYVQGTIIGIENMIAIVLATNFRDFEFKIGRNLSLFFERISPTQGTIQWPTASVISDKDTTALQGIIREMTFFRK